MTKRSAVVVLVLPAVVVLVVVDPVVLVVVPVRPPVVVPPGSGEPTATHPAGGEIRLSYMWSDAVSQSLPHGFLDDDERLVGGGGSARIVLAPIELPVGPELWERVFSVAPLVLVVPEDVMVSNVNLAIELENLSYFIQG